MRRVTFPGLPPKGQELPWIFNAIKKIADNSHLVDMEEIANNFLIENLTPVRELDWATATTDEKLDLLATFIDDTAKGGAKRV